MPNNYEEIQISELCIFRNIIDDYGIKKYKKLIKTAKKDKLKAKKIYYDLFHHLAQQQFEWEINGNLWKNYISHLIWTKENIFNRTAECNKDISETLINWVKHDIPILKDLIAFDWEAFTTSTSLPIIADEILDFSHIENKTLMQKGLTIICKIFEDYDDETLLIKLKEFYQEYGCGTYSEYIAYQWHEGLIPLKHPVMPNFSELIGYEYQKSVLIENTKAFLQKKKANHVLLYGEKGTGKSTSIKALLTEFADEGLRMIEINKQNFKDFYKIMEIIKNRHFRFIIYIDDLSFEASDVDYKYIKSCIEGSLENSAENILIYATSNRRHLIRENWNDRNEGDNSDIHISETHQEKLSLADRFGITLGYYAPNKEHYLEIVKSIATKEGINMPEELLRAEAMKWEIAGHGFSGRTARQFVNYLCSKQN